MIGGGATGFTVAMTMGSLENIGKIESGLAYMEMLDAGIDPNIAAAASVGVGVINAALEIGQLKGVLAPFRKLINDTTSKVVRDGILMNVVKGVARYGKDVSKETLQEVAQDAVNITFTELAKRWDNEANNKNIPYATAQEAFNQLKETAIQSALGFAGMHLPGHALTVRKEIAGTMAVQTEEATAKTMPVNAEGTVAATSEAGTTSDTTTGENVQPGIDFEGEEQVSEKDRFKAEKLQAEVETVRADYDANISELDTLDTAIADAADVSDISDTVGELKAQKTKIDAIAAEIKTDTDAIDAEVAAGKTVAASVYNRAYTKIIDLNEKIKDATKIRERLKIARNVKDPREKLAIITGKHKVGEIMTEDTVEAAIAEAPHTVKGTLEAGIKQGIAETRAKTEAREAKKAERAYIKKLARKITKPPSLTNDFYYRKQIEALQAPIDPNFRMEKTMKSRERLKDYLERNPDARADINKKTLSMLEKKPLNEMTVADLETVAQEVDRLRKLGRLKVKLQKMQATRRFRELRDQFVDIVTKGKGIKDIRGIGRATEKEGPGKKALGVHLHFLRPMRIFDLFDGGKNFRGVIHEFFYNKANEITDAEYVEIDRRKAVMKEKQKEFGIKTDELFKSIKIESLPGKTYSVDEVMDLYAGMKNPLKRDAILYGNKFEEAQVWELVDQLTPEQKAFADAVVREYDDNYERLRSAHIAYKNEDLGKESNYTPIQRTDIVYGALEVELAQDLTERANLKRAYAKRGMTIPRIKIAKEHQKEIRLGLMSTWMDQIHKQEHYIAGAEKIKEMQRMANDEQFTGALMQRYGKEAVKITRDYVNRVANPNIYKAMDSGSKAFRALRGNIGIAYLGFNLVTMAKQTASLFSYLADAGPVHLIASAVKTAVRPLNTLSLIESKMPQIKNRSIDRFTEEMKQVDRNAYERIMGKVGRAGMLGIQAMDKITCVIGAQAVYDRCIYKGMSEPEAIREAQNATMRTQSAAHAKDLAKVYASNEFLNSLLMFQNEANQVYNILTYDIPMRIKTGKIKPAIHALTGLALSGLVIWSLSNRRLPEDEDDVMEAVSDQFLQGLPLLGDDIVAKRKGWDNSGIVGIEALQNIGTIPFEKSDKVKVDKALEAACVALGLPYISTKRFMKTFETGKLEELVGGGPKTKKGDWR